MQRRVISRAATAALTALLVATIAAYADTVPGDGDAVAPGNQTLIDLPDSSPGAEVTWPVTFRLTCAGLNHAAAGASITLDLASASVPLDGHVSATTTTIGPVPADWTAPSTGCPSPAPTLLSNGPSVVTMTMPTTPGDSYLFTMSWSRFGATGLTGTSAVTFRVNVVGNTPPTLDLPSDILAEATSPAGAAVSFSATATDAEDATPPTPVCDPASGSTFPLGMTTVNCSVTDDGGKTATGSFLVSVEDTTVPTLHDVPADRNLTTTDPSGATLTYVKPTATDSADGSPSVGCTPASGSVVPVGTTTVTCTATDATGNHTSAAFQVNVTLVSAVTWSAAWGEPVGSSGATFVANPGRNVPVKVQVFADGVEQRTGRATISVTTCEGASVGSMVMTWGGGRWNGSLDTGALGGPGCYVATASLDGNVAGSFRIDLRGDPTAVKGAKSRGKP